MKIAISGSTGFIGKHLFGWLPGLISWHLQLNGIFILLNKTFN